LHCRGWFCNELLSGRGSESICVRDPVFQKLPTSGDELAEPFCKTIIDAREFILYIKNIEMLVKGCIVS